MALAPPLIAGAFPVLKTNAMCDDWYHWAHLLGAPWLTCSAGPLGHHLSVMNCTILARHHPPGVLPWICGRCYNHSWNAMILYDNVVSRSPIGTPTGAAHGTIPASGTPWPPQPAGQAHRFHDFWTRLCSACEIIEQDRFEVAIANFVTPPAAVILAGQWDQPTNTCTCLKLIEWQVNLGPPPDPIGHGPVAAVPGACAQPPTLPYSGGTNLRRLCHVCHDGLYDELKAERDLNDEWLRTTSRSADGRLCLASAATKNRRDTLASSSHRACRCGADVDVPPHLAEVLLCMACSGLRCLVRKSNPGSRYNGLKARARRNVPTAPLAPQSRGTGNLTLGRPRNQFLDTHAQ